VDGLKTLPKKIRIITNQQNGNTGTGTGKDANRVKYTRKPGVESSRANNNLVVGGYAEKSKVITATTPKERINFQNMNVNMFIPVSPKGEPTVNAFDKVKGAFYSTVDTVAATSSKIDKKKTEAAPVPITFKPLVQSSRSLTMSADVRQALIDRGSENPVKRAKAELTILQWEQGYYDADTLKLQKDQESSGMLKESIYKVGDVVEDSINGLEELLNKVMGLPEKVSKFVENCIQFLNSVPDRSQQALDQVNAIPTRLEEQRAEAEKSLQQSIDELNQLVADFKAIPDNVQRSVEQTKAQLDATVDSVNELTTKSKVLLGLEKPVPKPPSIPPPVEAPPLTASSIGIKVAGGLVTGTAKAVWWVGKNAATWAITGVQNAVSRQQELNKDTDTVSAPLENKVKSTDIGITAEQRTSSVKVNKPNGDAVKASAMVEPKPPTMIKPNVKAAVAKPNAKVTKPTGAATKPNAEVTKPNAKVTKPNGFGAAPVANKPNGAAKVANKQEKRSVETSSATDKKEPALERPELLMGVVKKETPTFKQAPTVATDKKEEAAMEQPERNMGAKGATSPELSDLDRQVEEALRLAEDALKYVSEKNNTDPFNGK
jgi:uncharacterized protein (UPF0147 family)